MVKRNTLKIVYRRASELKESPRNAKIHGDYDVGVLANNIDEVGFKVPFVIDRDGVLICGHGRKLALERLGRADEEYPCVYADDLTPEQADLFRLSENMSSDKAGYDFDKLDEELERLKDICDFDLGSFGFDEFDSVTGGPDADDGEVDDDDVPDVDPHPRVPRDELGIGDAYDPRQGATRRVTCPHCGLEFDVRRGDGDGRRNRRGRTYGSARPRWPDLVRAEPTIERWVDARRVRACTMVDSEMTVPYITV